MTSAVSVKCSLSDYNAFKEDHLCYSWHWHLLTTELRATMQITFSTFHTHLLLLMIRRFSENRNVSCSVSLNKRSFLRMALFLSMFIPTPEMPLSFNLILLNVTVSILLLLVAQPDGDRVPLVPQMRWLRASY
jgi:uncharacterized membrane protein